MSATTYGPTAPAFTAARVTRLAKAAAPELRWSSERAANGGFLVRVWGAPADGTDRTELRLLNDARRLIQAAGLSASVTVLRSRRAVSRFRILVTSEEQEAARMQAQEDARQAALAEARAEVAAAGEKLTVREAHAVITGTADDATAAKVTVREAAALERAEPTTEEGGVDPLTCADCGRGADSEAHEVDHPYRIATSADPSYRSIRARAYEVLSGGQVIGRVLCTVHNSDVLRWEAYLPGGGSVGTAETRQLAARLLTERPDLGSSPAARQVAEQEAATVPCWHVETAHGALYGVAATALRDALSMVQDRLTEERSADLPKRGQRVGTWRTAYGTVLCYRGPAEPAAGAQPVRIAVDADCPGCGYPERSYDPASGVFGCSSLRGGGRCGYESTERDR